jgi:hypothetical protein
MEMRANRSTKLINVSVHIILLCGTMNWNIPLLYNTIVQKFSERGLDILENL